MTDVSLDTVLATGATTARTLAAMASDETNVVGFGAVLNGSTDDSAAFTAAYNHVPSNGVVYIPSGNLNAFAITENAGKSVLWVTEGTLDYGTSIAMAAFNYCPFWRAPGEGAGPGTLSGILYNPY